MLKSCLLKNTAGIRKRSIENVKNLREERVQNVPVLTKIFASSNSGDQRPTKIHTLTFIEKKCIAQISLVNGSTAKNL